MDELRAFDLDLAERLPLIGSGRGDQVWQRRVDTSGRKCGGARVGRGPIGRQLAVGDGAHARPMTTLAGKDERLARAEPNDDRAMSGCSRPAASARKPSASSSRSAARSTARCRRTRRVLRSCRATSVTVVAGKRSR